MNDSMLFKMRIFLIGTLLIVAGCSEINFINGASKKISSMTSKPVDSVDFKGLTRISEQEYYKIGAPYQIKGVWYYPKTDYGYVEEGIASWYGPNFHGKQTANGAIFNQNDISAAHRTLPMPSLVRVTNLENGKSLIVKVNDRGPFARNRIIDLSKAAAEALDMIEKGTALVRVEILAAESIEIAELVTGKQLTNVPLNLAANDSKIHNQHSQAAPKSSAMIAVKRQQLGLKPAADLKPSPSTISDQMANKPRAILSTPQVKPPLPAIFIQAGAFGQYQNALRAKAQIEQKVKPVLIEQYNQSQIPLFRVRLGPIYDTDKADRMLNIVQNLGFDDAHIISPSLK